MKLRLGRDATKKLSRIPRHPEFKNSPKRDPNHQRDPNCEEIQNAKRSKSPRLPKGPRCQESKGSPKRSKGPRDPWCPSYQEIQVSKSFPEKSTLSEAEFSIVVAFLVKGPSLEPTSTALSKQIKYKHIIKGRVLPTLLSMSWKFRLLANLVH